MFEEHFLMGDYFLHGSMIVTAIKAIRNKMVLKKHGTEGLTKNPINYESSCIT